MQALHNTFDTLRIFTLRALLGITILGTLIVMIAMLNVLQHEPSRDPLVFSCATVAVLVTASMLIKRRIEQIRAGRRAPSRLNFAR